MLLRHGLLNIDEQQKITAMAKNTPFTLYKERYNEDFPEIYLLTKKLLLSCKRYNKLKAETEKFQDDRKSSTFTKTMRKKQLLFNVKADIFQDFYQTNQDPSIAKELATQNTTDPIKLKQNLRQEIIAKEKAIDRLEKDLRQYGWREALLSATARFFTNSLHYQVSEQFFFYCRGIVSRRPMAESFSYTC